MENFETKNPDTEQEKQKNNPDFDVMKVDQKEWQDTIKLDPKEMEKFKKFIESSSKLEDYEKKYFTSRLEWLSDKISNLNSRIDKMMDVTLFDSWDIDIKDGQDTAFLQEQVKKINSDINKLVWELEKKWVDMIWKIDHIFEWINKDSEKYLSVQKLKWFLAQKEWEKQKWILDKLGWPIEAIKKHKQDEEKAASELLNWWSKVKF